MIIRTGNRHVTANVEYHPWSGDHEVSPPTVRKATPEDLARLDAPDVMPRIIDAIGLIPKPIRGVYTDAEKRERTEHARKGSEATAKAHAVRREATQRTAMRYADNELRKDRIRAAILAKRGISDAALIAAVRTGGTVAAGARAVGLSDSTAGDRIRGLRERGALPADVIALLTPPPPKPGAARSREWRARKAAQA